MEKVAKPVLHNLFFPLVKIGVEKIQDQVCPKQSHNEISQIAQNALGGADVVGNILGKNRLNRIY